MAHTSNLGSARPRIASGDECGPGLIAKMLADLGLTRSDMKYVDMEWRFEYPAKVEQDQAGF